MTICKIIIITVFSNSFLSLSIIRLMDISATDVLVTDVLATNMYPWPNWPWNVMSYKQNKHKNVSASICPHKKT